MIKLPYGYGIDICDGGGYQFGLIKKTKVKDKSGEETDKDIIYNAIYPNSVESCVQKLYDIKKQELIANNDLTLCEYIEQIKRLNKEFKEILVNTLKEKI